MKKYLIIATVIILLAIAITMYNSTKKLECHELFIERLSEKQLTKSIDFDVMFTKEFFLKSLETVTDGNFTIYGDFGSKCSLPNSSDGFSGDYRTIIDNNLYVIEVRAFNVDRYKEIYKYLMNNLVETGESLIINDQYLFWIQNNVYYLIQANSDIIQKVKLVIGDLANYN